jgi:hypothetical protein
MRTFISVDAADYFGKNKPSGQLIKIKTPGDAGTLEAIGKSEVGGFPVQEFIDDYGTDHGALEAMQAYYEDTNGDGCSMKFLFELIGDEMKLVLG